MSNLIVFYFFLVLSKIEIIILIFFLQHVVCGQDFQSIADWIVHLLFVEESSDANLWYIVRICFLNSLCNGV